MAYVAVRIKADAADAESWVDALLDAGALSVDVSDVHVDTHVEAARYDEPGEAATAWWPVNSVTALFPSDADIDSALEAAGRALNRAVPLHHREAVAEQDWVRATQAQFGPIQIADRLWIVPSWCAPVDSGAINLVLDPGLAFGTGSHPTTRLCLEWLATELKRGADVLDFGCGSGILAIAAAKLGARKVMGADIDPQAIASSRDNAARNGVDATFFPADDFARTRFTVDVVVANILANPLIVLAEALSARVRVGGRIVLSGILDTQADDVASAYAGWFEIARWRATDGWVALTGLRR